jgi:hypothetical protein
MESRDWNQYPFHACVTRAFEGLNHRKHSRRYVDSIPDRLEVRGGSVFEERVPPTWSQTRRANECEHRFSLACPLVEVQRVR